MKKLLLSLLTVAAFSATSFVEAKKQDPSDVCATRKGCKNCKCDDGKICTKDECNKPKKERAPKKAKVASTKKMSDVVAAPTQRMSDVAAAEDSISDEQY